MSTSRRDFVKLVGSTAMLVPLAALYSRSASAAPSFGTGFGMLKDVLSRLPQKEYAFLRLLVTKNESSEKTKELVAAIRQLYGTYVQLAMMPNSEAIKKIGME